MLFLKQLFDMNIGIMIKLPRGCAKPKAKGGLMHLTVKGLRRNKPFSKVLSLSTIRAFEQSLSHCRHDDREGQRTRVKNKKRIIIALLTLRWKIFYIYYYENMPL